MIISNITNGFGNNIFQCVAGKILADFYNTQHFFYCKDPSYNNINNLEKLGFKNYDNNISFSSCNIVNESHYLKLFDHKYKDIGFFLQGYYENKDFYEDNKEKILNYFPKIKKTNLNDLVFHFRTGDRLFYKNEFNSKPSSSSIKNAIDTFKFEKLYVVTDMYDWKIQTPESIEKLKFHVEVNSDQKICSKESARYFNECYGMLEKYNPIIINSNVLDDFNFIRSFDKILFQHGTMSWWAAFLSDASRIGVYGPWREWKGSSNKNLSKVNFETWFTWK